MKSRDPIPVAVIVPALDEEATIAEVIARLPVPPAHVTVVDNGSTDRTAALALAAGARVIYVATRGYGRACLEGIAANPHAEILVFADADLSEHPEDAVRLIRPLLDGTADLVLGARVGTDRPWHASVGTTLCVRAINLGWGGRFTDLAPFRAIRRRDLERLGMADDTWGWTIEMQVKALEAGLRCVEVPIPSGPRAGGRSKISGSLIGTLRAARRMLTIIAELWVGRAARVAVYRAGHEPPTSA
jgi:glycosyltransferase involved in cell wall biosynthesis